MGSIQTFTDEQAAAALRSNPGLIQSSEDPWEATHETVEYMSRLIRESLDDGIVQRAAEQACRQHPRGGVFPVDNIEAIWSWVKRSIRFVHHSKLQAAWMPDPSALQLLIRPDCLLKMREPKGDCAVFTCLVCAMLDCAGVDWEIVTVAVDPRQPGIFSHVYPRAILEDGRRLPLDASHGQYPGWEVPASHVSAKQIWDSSGQPIEDAKAHFAGLHGVDMEYLYGRGGDRRGLGQDDDSSTGGDDGTVDADQAAVDASNSYIAGYNAAQADPNSGGSGASSTLTSLVPGAVATTTGGSTLAQDISALLTGGNAIAKTVTGTTTPTTVNSSLLLFGGIAVVGLLFVMMAGKK